MAGGQIVVPPSTVPAGVLPPTCFHHIPLLLLLLLLLGAPAVVPDLLREGLLHLLIANLDQGGRGEEDNWDEREFSHQQQVENSIRIFADILWDQDWGVLNCACCRWKTLMRRRYLGDLQRSLILAAGPTKEDSCEYLQVVRATQPSALTVVKETLPWDGGMLLFGKSIAFSSDSHFFPKLYYSVCWQIIMEVYLLHVIFV